MKHKKNKVLGFDEILSVIFLTIFGTALILVPIFTGDTKIFYPFNYIFPALGGFAYGVMVLVVLIPKLRYDWERYYGIVIKHRKVDNGYIIIQAKDLKDEDY